MYMKTISSYNIIFIILNSWFFNVLKILDSKRSDSISIDYEYQYYYLLYSIHNQWY